MGTLTKDMSMADAVTLLVDGHPGALYVLAEIYRWSEDPLRVILILDDMNLRGADIWELYRDVCDENIVAFIGQVLGRAPLSARS